MKKSLLPLSVGLLIGSLALSSPAQDALFHFLGVYYSHQSVEKYELSAGVTALGVPHRPQPREELREQINYPDFYGSLFGITSHGANVVFWFQDGAGSLRNAVVDQVTSRLYRLEKIPDHKLNIAVVRNPRGN